jgi:hypothetical protein
MILALVIPVFFVMVLIAATWATIRFGSRAEHLAFGIGAGLAFILAIVWHLEEVGFFHLSQAQYLGYGRLTFVIWPSSFMFIDVGPAVKYSVDHALFYLVSILVNGALYAGIVATVRKVWRLANKA